MKTETKFATDSELMNELALCEMLGIKSITARSWRMKGRGPRYIKCGRLVRYRRADVETWLAAQTIATEVTP